MCPLEAPIFRFPSGYVYLRTGVATGLGFRTYIYVQKYERVKLTSNVLDPFRFEYNLIHILGMARILELPNFCIVNQIASSYSISMIKRACALYSPCVCPQMKLIHCSIK